VSKAEYQCSECTEPCPGCEGTGRYLGLSVIKFRYTSFLREMTREERILMAMRYAQARYANLTLSAYYESHSYRWYDERGPSET